MNLWAVIPSRDRSVLLGNLTTQLKADKIKTVIVDTGYDPPLSESPYWKKQSFHIIRDDDPLHPNISRWWNLGLDFVAEREGDNEYAVAVLNDDLVIPHKFVQQLADALTRHNAAAAYPDQHGFFRDYVHRTVGPISMYRRMTGYAFALRGSAKIRADETIKWWYGDDDIDWTARKNGGSVLVGGLSVQHLLPNTTTVGKLAEQTGLDRVTFMKKWGRTPF